MPPEVAIIGAGMAGLAAARALAERGVTVEIFEASDRVGGRAETAYDADTTLPVELGPEYVHGAAAVTHRLLATAGLVLEPAGDAHHTLRDGQLVNDGDVFGRLAALLEPAKKLPADESAAAYLAHAHMGMADAALFAMLVEGFYAAPLADISIQSLVADASRDDDQGQPRIHGGYGRLVGWLAEQLAAAHVPIHLGCRVRAVDWTGPGVRVDFERAGRAESVTAARAIVTLPVGVLQAGDVAFTPGLGDHAAALAQLAMGPVVKPVLCFRAPVWAPYAPADLEFVHAPTGAATGAAFPTFWLRALGDAHQITAWAGGPHAQALAGLAPDALVARALDGFAAAVGMPRAVLADALAHHHYRDYLGDPDSRGAYSYTRVGGTRAAMQLAQPLADRLFFAGEATDPENEGTVAGALASGERAAAQISG